MIVLVYTDASYVVRQSNGKSHTGCPIAMGDTEVIAVAFPNKRLSPTQALRESLLASPTPLHKQFTFETSLLRLMFPRPELKSSLPYRYKLDKNLGV